MRRARIRAWPVPPRSEPRRQVVSRRGVRQDRRHLEVPVAGGRTGRDRPRRPGPVPTQREAKGRNATSPNLMRKQGRAPRVLATDKRASYVVAHKNLIPSTRTAQARRPPTANRLSFYCVKPGGRDATTRGPGDGANTTLRFPHKLMLSTGQFLRITGTRLTADNHSIVEGQMDRTSSNASRCFFPGFESSKCSMCPTRFRRACSRETR